MTARTRTRQKTETSLLVGTYFNRVALPQTQTLSRTAGHTWKTDDTIGNYPKPNFFQVIHEENYVPRMNGTSYDSFGRIDRQMNGAPIAFNPGASSPVSKFPIYSNVDLSNKAWDILASANPNVPTVSIPSFIGELKDIPSLVKDWGGDLLRKIAKGHISWRWAVRPMLGDLRAMYNFTKHVDERARMLWQLRDFKKLKRRVSLGTSKISDPPVLVTIQSQGTLIQAWRSVDYTSKEWGTVVYQLKPGYILPTGDWISRNFKLRALGEQLTYGITSYEGLAAAWELTPWSWLVDWFLGTGTMIAANNNTVPLLWADACFMRTLTSRSRYEIKYDPSQWVVLDGRPWESREVKTRNVVKPTLPVLPTALPFVDQGKWSILASLAILRKA